VNEGRINVDAAYAPAYEGSDFASIIVLLLIVFACLVSTVRPYSQKLLFTISYVDTVMISALAVTFDSTVLDILENSPMHTSTYKFTSRLIRVITALVPLIYITLIILKRLLWRRNSYFHKLITYCLRRRSTKDVEEPLPDRLVRPSAYYGSIIRVTAARTGTPHIHNSCCIEESSLENKFILHRLITSCPLEVEVQRIFTRPIATPLYPVWVLLSLKLGRG